MKNVRFWLFLGLLIPCGALGANGSDFQSAAQLLSAARRGDIQTVQYLINSGVDINYTDSTGLSLVCTAVMNNDKRAIQILQMYGADASNCDNQIKQYRRRKNVAANGEEYDFFSGLSSSHIVVLSALGVAGVIGGISLLTDAFDSDNKNGTSSSGGTRPGGGGNNSSSSTKGFTIPYGPAYINTTTGAVNADDTSKITDYLSGWSATTGSAYAVDFNYIRRNTSDNYIADGLNPLLENYLLVMGGYYSMANGYMGQYTHRKDPANGNYTPVLSAIEGYPQGRPVRVALITNNGINPSGSADSANGITYAVGTSVDAATPHVDKYLNNTADPVTDTTGLVVSYNLTENSGFDLSGSGSAFNPFANVDESALAKIVAGWEGHERAQGDLYGFVPNGQLAIYRTGAGSFWQDLSGAHNDVGTFTNNDSDANILSAGDIIELNGQTYLIENAVDSSVTTPTITVNGKTYKVASASKMFVAKCTSDTNLSDIAIYIGTDGFWYVNSSGGDDIDAVYAVDSSNNIYVKKEQVVTGYSNFAAMEAAATRTYSVGGTTDAVDVIANTSVIPASRQNYYVTTNTLLKAMSIDGTTSDVKTFYKGLINSEYGVYESYNQGDLANNLFNGYSSNKPMIVMPAGDYTMGIVERDDGGNLLSREVYLNTLEATFENYAPMLYTNLNHNFMTIVGVSHDSNAGTSTATSVDNYGDGIGGAYGKLQLSVWTDVETDSVTGNTTTTTYASRMCGLSGVGDAANGVDPWCFAASGPTAEMATASAAGAVASVKSAFSYMTNNQIYTLLALTADGPYLNANTDGEKFSTDSLVTHLQNMYEMPLEYNISGLSSDEYLDLFKTVFGYGLINVRRAIKPGASVYYYDNTTNSIVLSDDRINRYWGTSSRASSVLSLTGHGAIRTSFYDVLESNDGTLSLPRVWNSTIAMDTNESKYGLYMGDVLGDFDIDSTNKRTNKVGNLTIDMAISSRAYNDNMNGLDDMRVTFSNEKFDLATEYQHHLTDGESRFNGRANGLLNLVSNSISMDATYKHGNFGFGGRAFIGAITDENLVDTDPVVSSQYEPGRLGLVNGGAMDAKYNNDTFGLNMSFGVMHEDNTVLGMVSDGLLALNGADTKYVDAIATYKPFDDVKLSLRGTYAITDAVADGLFISDMSNITSNSFAFGLDVAGFGFTAAMPLAVVDGKMGYGYADFEVVENNDKYEIAMNNAHTEYVDLSAVKRELRFTTTYKQSIGAFTDAGVGFIYRVNPNNTDAFGNESIFMFKVHHRLGI